MPLYLATLAFGRVDSSCVSSVCGRSQVEILAMEFWILWIDRLIPSVHQGYQKIRNVALSVARSIQLVNVARIC